MKMRKAMTVGTLLGVAALLLAGCGSSEKDDPNVLNNGQCMSIADTLKTLRKGDALPRVVQVMGQQPARSYRVIAPFGNNYDVVEYDVGTSACAKMVLNAPKKLELVFDAQGGYIGSGRGTFRKLQAATLVRVQGLPVDINQFDAPQ